NVLCKRYIVLPTLIRSMKINIQVNLQAYLKRIVRRSTRGAYSALMEVILNSIHACNRRVDLEGEEYNPKISVIFDKTNLKVSVVDNGIGITNDQIQNVFLCIGKSYHTDSDLKLSITGDRYRGYGFIEVFNISDVVEITTHHIYDPVGSRLIYDISKSTVSVEKTHLGENKGTSISFQYNSFLKYVGDELEVEKILNRVGGFSSNIQISVQSINTRFIGTDIQRDAITSLEFAIKRMETKGDISDLIEQLKDYNRRISNRDLMSLDEKHFKFYMLMMFNLYSDYTVISEQEVENGYIDILLRRKLSCDVNYEWIIEFKYLKMSARKNLEKIRKEGLSQVKSYVESREISEAIPQENLKSVVITFLGKEDIFLDWYSPI
uniref:PD-(D/E)XK nuclease domain-containing protein n=1 Tax=Aliivibrio fischeri TaxID=668 RepID=UPI000AF0EDA0